MMEFIALDFETTGKYPISAEICEAALIRFDSKGDVLGEWSSLIKPRVEMTKVSESIHGLSLKDLEGAPYIEDVLGEMLEFIGEAPLVGHNISFDLGFLAWELDKFKGEGWLLNHLKNSHYCTSFMSLNMLPNLPSHRLMHLVEHFGLEESPNHRAHQDALTCKNVFLKLINGAESMKEVLDLQGQELLIKDFSSLELLKRRPELKSMVEAGASFKDFELIYSKGSRKNKWRKLTPKGLVLKSNEDSFLVAVDPGETQTKRFMVNKVLNSRNL
jgi:DNA polymerase III epsilon subunit family exonuclease